MENDVSITDKRQAKKELARLLRMVRKSIMNDERGDSVSITRKRIGNIEISKIQIALFVRDGQQRE